MPQIDSSSNPQHIAALDLGSNSFHFVLAKIDNESLQILHSEKYQVKLADGLSEDGLLSEEAILRGLDALKTLKGSVVKINEGNFRAVATYTLRKAKNAHEFLSRAAEVFPYDIEVVSGHEEARLIYQGARQYLSADNKRLVLDIGGGSTECIIGKGSKIHTLDSVNVGCVSLTKRFFANQKISKQAFEKAELYASSIFDSIKGRFLKVDWQVVNGTSGTIKSIYHVVNSQHELAKPITLKELYRLKAKLLSFNSFDEIEIENLKHNRQNVICAGLAILIALFETLEIDELDYCDYSLREGVIFETLDQHLNKNIHQRTMSSLISRFNIDVEQSQRVSTVAQVMFNSVKHEWNLTKKPYKELLMWAIQLHEIGFSINTSGYHKHGKYILENLDLPGFNREQSQAISWLVGSQRKKITMPDNYQWHLLSEKKLTKLLVILRLACLFNKQRQLTGLLSFSCYAKKQLFNLSFDADWEESNNHLLNNLQTEQGYCSGINIELKFN